MAKSSSPTYSLPLPRSPFPARERLAILVVPQGPLFSRYAFRSQSFVRTADEAMSDKSTDA